MPGQPNSPNCRSVLIVDPSDDVREVLRTALSREGTQILEARRATEGLQLAQTHQIDLIVLDGETPHVQQDWQELDEAARKQCTPLVVLGSARLHGANLTSGHFIEKPYHYAPLIRRIEGLLGC